MKIHNFVEKIPLYYKTNPKLSNREIAILLLIDHMYLENPDDLKEFWRTYPHFDPQTPFNAHDGITFLDIVDANYSDKIAKTRLNDYINIKFNSLGTYRSYEENSLKFKYYSRIISTILDNVLKKAKFPKELVGLFGEKKELRNCLDIFSLYKMYKDTKSRRIKFAILRKIGLIVLLARINRAYSLPDLQFATKEVESIFKKNLFKIEEDKRIYYYWADENYKVKFVRDDEQKASKLYTQNSTSRKAFASRVHSMQIFEATPFITYHNNKIVDFQIRTKFFRNDKLYYTSFVEKMIRKNLQFPNEVRDVIGIKIVVNEANDIPKLIDELEKFLGGSSTRKREKNAYSKFGQRQLNKYSSKEYTVWKAIYDIALPHPSINNVKEMIEMADPKNKELIKLLNDRIDFFLKNPRDFVVELQIQDIKSLLLSQAKGSVPHHENLKMNQVKENSFHKLFPEEIYKKELWELKRKILNVK